jgi:aldehyde:ferredoxin oxidoreductase
MDQMRRLLNGATGVGFSMEDMDNIALRVETLIRWLNVREGISREDDILPPRMWEEQIDGPRKGMKSFNSKNDFEDSLSKYYDLMGWDSSGNPTDETLKRLEVLDS